MTDSWASSTSPSLETLSSESPPSLFLVGWHIFLTLPGRLWDAYVTYLWYHQSNSWIGRAASTFRVIAIVLVLPVVLLTLLDVASYVIARTLGVVDDVKASTSDADTTADERQHLGAAVAVPVLPSRGVLPEGPARDSEGLASEDSVARRASGDGDGDDGRDAARGLEMRPQMQTRTERQTEKARLDVPPQGCYFTGDESLRLAGEGVFSPAASVPPSPLTPRIPLHAFTENDGSRSGQASEEEGIVLRRRVQGAREDEAVHT